MLVVPVEAQIEQQFNAAALKKEGVTVIDRFSSKNIDHISKWVDSPKIFEIKYKDESKEIVEKFPNKIINIHPSLLPKYGGKGMYGLNVHMEVLKNNEKKSGFTIHYVNDHYDKGSIIFQKSIPVETSNALELSKKILTQEHKYYPLIIKQVLNV